MATQAQDVFDEKTEARKHELLLHLEHIVLAKGFSSLTVADIAARLKCSRRSIYELAESKDQLVLSVLERFFKGVRESADTAAAPQLAPELRIFEYLQPGIEAAQRISQALVDDIGEWAPSREMWQAHLRLRMDGLRLIVEDGVERGVFKPVHAYLVAETVFASISRLRDPDFYTGVNMTIAEAFEEYYGMLLDSLRKR